MGLQGLRFGINITNIQAAEGETRMDVQLEKPESHLSPIGIKRYPTNSTEPGVPEIASKVVDLGDRFTLTAKEGKVVGLNPDGEELELPREIVAPLLAATLKDTKLWTAPAEVLSNAVRQFIEAIGGDSRLAQALSDRLK